MFRFLWLCVFSNFCFTSIIGVIQENVPYPNERELNKDFWVQKAQQRLKETLGKRLRTGAAKNVVFFLGDGMGIPVVTAARIYRGQKNRLVSEQTPFAFEEFPFTGVSRTYALDRHVTDSANSAAAFLCGTKTNFGTIGMGPEGKRDDCQSSLRYSVDSIATWAINEGKAAGAVTSTRVTHATPANLYAHSANRYWENDADLEVASEKGVNITGCSDIARQLIESFPGNEMDVIMGGGERNFLQTPQGRRLDGRNLVEEWTRRGGKRTLVRTREELLALDPDDVDKLLGLFAPSHLNYFLTKETDSTEPTLEEMTRVALKTLSKKPNGFFLLVEGGRIDQALHYNWGKKSFEEVIQFDLAIQAALELTDPEETLIVVTADHDHVLTIAGYPPRNIPIFGIFEDYIEDNYYPEYGEDRMKVQMLTFANGPAGVSRGDRAQRRRDLTKEDTEAPEAQQMTFVERNYDTHGGSDVAVYATGPSAHFFTGTFEDNYLAHAMAHALRVGLSGRPCLQWRRRVGVCYSSARKCLREGAYNGNRRTTVDGQPCAIWEDTKSEDRCRATDR